MTTENPDWPALVAAVPHGDECASDWPSEGSCDCDRDARIGRKFAAALHKATEMAAYGAARNLTDPAAARAFEGTP